MLRVMLVDDEVLALEFLREVIDWNQYGFQIVGQALNGKRALELFQKENPHIIISDIKMSVMDGLELSKKVKEINPHTKIILLSAYKDFEYAKKGIQYGVSNYLLKHEISEASLLGELGKVKSEIYREEEWQQAKKRYFLKNIIYDAPKEENRKEDTGVGNQLFMIMLQFNKPLFYDDGKIERQPAGFHTIMDSLRKEPVSKITYVTDVQISEDNYLVLYNADQVRSEYEAEELIYQKALYTERVIRELGKGFYGILCSRRFSHNQVAATFRELSRKIRYSPFMKQNKYYFLDQIPAGDPDEEVELLKEFELLDWNLNQAEDEWSSGLDRMFQTLCCPKWNLSALKNFLSTWLYYEKKWGEKFRLVYDEFKQECYTVDQLSEYCVSCCRRICTEMQQDIENSYSVNVRQIISFIQDHFREELTLDYIGAKFQMNGVYLGQLFKKEVGTTFLKFLTDYRISQAKIMLEDGQYQVAEVAERVGYKTSQYFSQIFYKYMSMTPQDYKKWGKQGGKEKLKEKNTD